MATIKIAKNAFRHALRNSQNQRQILKCNFNSCSTIQLFDSRQRCFSSSSSSTPQVLMEELSHAADNNNDENDASNTITKITLDRPKANAMGKQLISEFNACLDALEDKSASECRCVVLTSSSDRVFSAGADLKERATMTQEETYEFVSLLRSTMERVASLPMPVIAAVEGVALGGGLELALAADLRICAPTAVLGLPETSLAILPGAGGTQRLPRLIGEAKAKELIWTGQKLTGAEALECGLVNEVATPATERAVDLARAIASNGPVAIRASKVAIREGGKQTCMTEALEIERECYAEVVPTKDRLEGLRAFREGRTPSYTGE